MSTMTQAVSSPAIRRAHRCRVLDSLKPSFSSSSLATAGDHVQPTGDGLHGR